MLTGKQGSKIAAGNQHNPHPASNLTQTEYWHVRYCNSSVLCMEGKLNLKIV